MTKSIAVTETRTDARKGSIKDGERVIQKMDKQQLAHF
jgi:hypothetical protein